MALCCCKSCFGASAASGENIETGPDSVTDIARLREMAGEQGYLLLEGNREWYTKEQLEEAVEKARDEALDTAREEKPDRVRSFMIVPGMTSDDVADILLQLDLVQDKERFLELLTERQLHGKIRARIYHFRGEPDLETVVGKITKK